MPQIFGVPDHGMPGEVDRPEPVLDAAKVASAVSGAVGALGAALVLVGWATAEQVQSWVIVTGGAVSALATLVAVVAPIVAAYRARGLVTPLESPRNSDGTPLMAVPGLRSGPA